MVYGGSSTLYMSRGFGIRITLNVRVTEYVKLYLEIKLAVTFRNMTDIMVSLKINFYLSTSEIAIFIK